MLTSTTAYLIASLIFHLLDSKGTTGTNSAAEAAKILAENRRLMREQKEKEEQLRIQREEEEKWAYCFVLTDFSLIYIVLSNACEVWLSELNRFSFVCQT